MTPILRLPVDVVVVGAGIIGVSIASELAHAGRSVTLVDPSPASGATYAAAGMLAPVSEYEHQSDALLRLLQAGNDAYPGFLERLEIEHDLVDYAREDTLLVGVDSGDRQALADLHHKRQALGLPSTAMTRSDVRAREDLLGPSVTCGYRMAGDYRIDPRALTQRLLDGFSMNPLTTTIREQVAALIWSRGSEARSRVTGVRLTSGEIVHAKEVVLANGLNARDIDALPEGLSLPLRPVYGEILRLRAPDSLTPLIETTVRGLVNGEHIYLVPRRDGTIVVGATQREDERDGVNIGGVYRLLRDAQVLLPAIAECELVEATARARPTAPDHAPIVGRVRVTDDEIAGLLLATGFYRHGVLLAPWAAQTCRRLVDGAQDDAVEFRADRFSHTYAETGMNATPRMKITSGRETS